MVYTVTDNNERISREKIYQNMGKRHTLDNDRPEINCFYDYGVAHGMTFSGFTDESENYSGLVDKIGEYIHEKMEMIHEQF